MSSMSPPRPSHRIQWHEGMLLAPQHFQQESARLDELIAWQHLSAQPLAWGLRRLEIDEGLLVNGWVQVRALEAVMPDGMGVAWSAQDAQGQDLALDLKPWAAQMEAGDVPIYLTLGRARSLRGTGPAARFRAVAGDLIEDEVSEALAIDIPRAVPNLALTAGDVPSSAYGHLKLMTVRKDNEVFRRGPHVPPMLDLPPDHALHQRAQALAAQMRSKAAFLVKQAGNPSSRIEDRLAILESKVRLGSLVAALPLLEALLRSPALSPYALFLALCAQLGPLATLRPGAVPLLPPAWTQDDPLASLGPVLDSLEDFVAEVSQEWRTALFDVEGSGFSLAVEPGWTAPRWVLGLRGQPERELVAWMAGAVIGSRSVWSALADRRVLGAPRQRIDAAPELGLRSSAGYTLFALDVDERFIVTGEPLVIGNANEASATPRPHELVMFLKG